MSTITVRQRWNVNGVPTDVTSFVLADPTDSFGIVRADTNEVVVASGTAMTWVATGQYEYSFTAPAPGLTYTAYYRVTAADGNVYQLQDQISDTTEESVPMPDLTGNVTQDTLNALLVERLRVARAGPKPGYSLHGHAVAWTDYLAELDRRILNVRIQLAQEGAWEEVGIGV